MFSSVSKVKLQLTKMDAASGCQIIAGEHEEIKEGNLFYVQPSGTARVYNYSKTNECKIGFCKIRFTAGAVEEENEETLEHAQDMQEEETDLAEESEEPDDNQDQGALLAEEGDLAEESEEPDDDQDQGALLAEEDSEEADDNQDQGEPSTPKCRPADEEVVPPPPKKPKKNNNPESPPTEET
jgi:NACalpha-BTF3-like transcription factor